MDLEVESAGRVRSYWRGWEARSTTADTVSIVEIGRDRFVIAPERLRGRLEGQEPDDLAALVAMLGGDVAPGRSGKPGSRTPTRRRFGRCRPAV